MIIILILAIVICGLYCYSLNEEKNKLVNKILDFENEIRSWEITVDNRNQTIKELNILVSLKDKVTETLTEEIKKRDIEIRKQETKLIKDLEVNTTPLEFKDENPKIIKRQYNKKKH